MSLKIEGLIHNMSEYEFTEDRKVFVPHSLTNFINSKSTHTFSRLRLKSFEVSIR